MFKHIVIGCDGTSKGRDATRLAVDIAAATGARLSLVGVFSPSLFPVAGSSDRKALHEQNMRMLCGERDRLAPDALIETVADSSVPRALRRVARRWHAQLIVIGSSRAAAPGRVAIGRRGRQLLYDAPFSLAIAPAGFAQGADGLRSIGVGYDGGPEAQAALTLAASLASAAHARLQVRRVIEDRVPPLTSEQWLAITDWDHAHIWETARQRALAETEASVSRLGVQAEATATVGDAGYDLRAVSDTVDLFVVGSRRWGPIARLVNGGVGETLVADAGGSIVIVARPSPPRHRRAVQARHTFGHGPGSARQPVRAPSAPQAA